VSKKKKGLQMWNMKQTEFLCIHGCDGNPEVNVQELYEGKGQHSVRKRNRSCLFLKFRLPRLQGSVTAA
jgi:hypothetical protein